MTDETHRKVVYRVIENTPLGNEPFYLYSISLKTQEDNHGNKKVVDVLCNLRSACDDEIAITVSFGDLNQYFIPSSTPIRAFQDG